MATDLNKNNYVFANAQTFNAFVGFMGTIKAVSPVFAK